MREFAPPEATGKTRGTKSTPDVARDLCQRASAKAYIAGAIASLGSQYVIRLDAVNCKTVIRWHRKQVTAENKEHVLKAFGRASTKLRAKTRRDAKHGGDTRPPSDQATTPDLGLAVALEQGLVVPVIRRANELTVAEIHLRAQDLTAKARAGQLTPAEMTGSTFTISNLGMMDVENFTAIINPGESAILAVSSGSRQPVVKNDQVVVRTMMKMTLSSDHRCD